MGKTRGLLTSFVALSAFLAFAVGGGFVWLLLFAMVLQAALEMIVSLKTGNSSE